MDHITKAQIMGLGTRIFIVNDDDTLKRMPMKRYHRLFKRHPEERFLEYADNRIRYVLVVLEMINRKPAEILMAEYSFLAFDSKGRLDAGEREKAARLAMDTLEPILPGKKLERLIDAKHKFAKKRFDDRYIWKPTPDIETAIQRAIFS
jgi:hypothetical protein